MTWVFGTYSDSVLFVYSLIDSKHKNIPKTVVISFEKIVKIAEEEK